MSKYARHEIVMNGVNTEGKLQRTLVLDAELQPRHVFRLNKHYAKRYERTSQFAYSGDTILETTATFNEEKQWTSWEFKVYRLSGPCSGAGGRLQLFRLETPEYLDKFTGELLDGELTKFREFMLMDVISNKTDPETIDGVLPTFLGWDGYVGITEEKQSAYIIDLLGGAPVSYTEYIATMAMYSKRAHIMPFETLAIPECLNFHNAIPATAGFTPRPDCEINWVAFHVNGLVEVITDQEQADNLNLNTTYALVKLYLEPFATETGENFGLVVESYARTQIQPLQEIEEEEVLSV